MEQEDLAQQDVQNGSILGDSLLAGWLGFYIFSAVAQAPSLVEHGKEEWKHGGMDERRGKEGRNEGREGERKRGRRCRKGEKRDIGTPFQLKITSLWVSSIQK